MDDRSSVHSHLTSTHITSPTEGITDDLVTPRVAQDTTIRARDEKSGLGDWMGTWWGKPRSKHARASSVVQPSESQIKETEPPVPDSEATTPMPNGEPAPTRSTRRKSGKSVFGTLGFSILNPSASTVAKKRRTRSATDTPATDSPAGNKDEPLLEDDLKAEARIEVTPVQALFEQGSISSAEGPPPPILSSTPEPMDPESRRGSRPASVAVQKEETPLQGSALRAIVNATRVMTADPTSVLDDGGHHTGDLVSRLAYDLVRNTRDQGVAFRERPRERPRPRVSLPVPPEVRAAQDEPSAQALTIKTRRTTVMADAIASASPIFGTFFSQQQRRISTVVDAVQKGVLPDTGSPLNAPTQQGVTSPQNGPSGQRRPGSLPLESIIPASAKPPTQYLSRTYTPLTARDFRAEFVIPPTVSRLSRAKDDGGPPPADRYGFVYDAAPYDLLLLRRARLCGCSAPACLTGVRIADRREDDGWDESGESALDSIEVIRAPCDCEGAADAEDTSTAGPAGDELASDAASMGASRSRGTSPSSSRSKRRPRSGTTTSGAPPAPTPPKADTSILAVTDDTPRHLCANVIRRLLAELTELHDNQENARRKEWDAFVRQRRKAKTARSGAAISSAAAAVAGGAAAVLGLGTTLEEEELAHTEGLVGVAHLGLLGGKEERKELYRLVRAGVPLVYRAKVWLECAGAIDMREPGLFRDLLAQNLDDGHVRAEIEKDVGRTMPLNVFFGGDGAGVDKLRRVLTAYSR